MGKQYYTEYGLHMLRLYFRHNISSIQNDISILNWTAVEKVVMSDIYSEIQREIFKDIFTSNRSFYDNIAATSIKHKTDENKIYNLVYSLVNKVVKERGLI